MNKAPAAYALCTPAKPAVGTTTPSLCRRTDAADIRHFIHRYFRNAVLVHRCTNSRVNSTRYLRHLQGGGGRRCGGIVDRQQRSRWKFRQVIWRNVNESVHKCTGGFLVYSSMLESRHFQWTGRRFGRYALLHLNSGYCLLVSSKQYPYTSAVSLRMPKSFLTPAIRCVIINPQFRRTVCDYWYL